MKRKRKTFGKVFLQKLFWITIILVGLFFGGLSVFVTVTKDNFRNDVWEAESARRRDMRELAAEELDDFDRKQQFKGAIMAETNQALSVLYDAETKELIAGCEELIAILRAKTDEAPGTVYCYPTEKIQGWDEHREKVKELQSAGKLVRETVEMPYFYLKEDTVLPGPFTVSVSVIDIFDFETAKDGYEPQFAFVSSFEAPKELTKEYEQKELTMNNLMLEPLIIGYNESNPWIHQHAKGAGDAYALLQQLYADLLVQGNEPETMEEETYFKLKMVSVTHEELKDGRKVGLLLVACYDVWSLWKEILIIIVLGLLLFDVVLAFILAQITYAGLKAQYATEDYRMNLMNAMAHDLKSPLMSISGYAENLEGNMNPGKQEHYTKEIRGTVQYMNEMIESILALSKVEKDGVCLCKERVEVPNLLREVQKRYEWSMEEKNLKMAIEGQLTLQADKGLMLQVLDNLLGNAVKYATPGSVVRVSLSDKELRMINDCETDLSDIVDKLCEPFVVGSKSRSGINGSGIGLAIVKNICELHKYGLKVEYEKGQFIVKIIFLKNNRGDMQEKVLKNE